MLLPGEEYFSGSHLFLAACSSLRMVEALWNSPSRPTLPHFPSPHQYPPDLQFYINMSIVVLVQTADETFWVKLMALLEDKAKQTPCSSDS